MDRRAFLTTAIAASTPLLAGCLGGDGGGESAGSGGSTTTSSSGDDAQSAFPDYTWDQLAEASPIERDAVAMERSQFYPLVVVVAPGTEVTFTNDDSGPHTVTIPARSVDEQVSGGDSTTVTFEEAGTFDYVCTFHPPNMLGRVVVE